MSDDDKKPEVVIPPELQAQMDADPALAEAMAEFSRIAVEAMEGVKSGKYPSFDIAMEFLTGNKPEPVRFDPIQGQYVDMDGNIDRDDDDPEPN